MTNIRHITVELIVACDSLSDQDLELTVRDNVIDVVRNSDYTILEACAYTRNEDELDALEELEVLREIAYTYVRQGVQVAEWFVNEEGAQ